MSFGSTIEKTINEIKKIEGTVQDYKESIYNNLPTKYILSLYRRCSIHSSSHSWDNRLKIEINYLLNAKDRLKKVLNKRENIWFLI